MEGAPRAFAFCPFFCPVFCGICVVLEAAPFANRPSGHWLAATFGACANTGPLIIEPHYAVSGFYGANLTQKAARDGLVVAFDALAD